MVRVMTLIVEISTADCKSPPNIADGGIKMYMSITRTSNSLYGTLPVKKSLTGYAR